MEVRVSSPGCAFILGEYGARFGTGALAAAINLRTFSTVRVREDRKIFVKTDFGNYQAELEGGDIVVGGDIGKNAELSLFTIEDFYGTSNFGKGVDVEIRSEIPFGGGLGSSAAMISSLYGALLVASGKVMNKGELLEICKPLQAIAHGGKTTGTELMASIMGGVVEVEWDVPHPSTIRLGEKLVVGHFYHPFKTSDVRAMLDQQAEIDPFGFDDMMFGIKEIVAKGKEAVARGDMGELGKLMLLNQSLLSGLGLSTIKAEELIRNARAEGALGAKVSGLGGGNCVIALAPEKEEKVKEAFRKAGAKAFVVRSCDKGTTLEGKT